MTRSLSSRMRRRNESGLTGVSWQASRMSAPKSEPFLEVRPGFGRRRCVVRRAREPDAAGRAAGLTAAGIGHGYSSVERRLENAFARQEAELEIVGRRDERDALSIRAVAGPRTWHERVHCMRCRILRTSARPPVEARRAPPSSDTVPRPTHRAPRARERGSRSVPGCAGIARWRRRHRRSGPRRTASA